MPTCIRPPASPKIRESKRRLYKPIERCQRPRSTPRPRYPPSPRHGGPTRAWSPNQDRPRPTRLWTRGHAFNHDWRRSKAWPMHASIAEGPGIETPAFNHTHAVQHRLKSASEVQQNKLKSEKSLANVRQQSQRRSNTSLESEKSLANACQHRRGSGNRDTRLQPHPRGPADTEAPNQVLRRPQAEVRIKPGKRPPAYHVHRSNRNGGITSNAAQSTSWRPWTPRPRYLPNTPYLTSTPYPPLDTKPGKCPPASPATTPRAEARTKAWQTPASTRTPSEAKVHTKAERPVFNARRGPSYRSNGLHQRLKPIPRTTPGSATTTGWRGCCNTEPDPICQLDRTLAQQLLLAPPCALTKSVHR